MATIILSIVIVLLAAGGLAVGLLFGRAPIKGSCGGLACRNDTGCEGCSRHR
ncbi:MAG: hypothetical protein ACR2OV_02420 [Hyphomicrobiaceae bacterium]|jgi:hypothetical protein